MRLYKLIVTRIAWGKNSPSYRWLRGKIRCSRDGIWKNLRRLRAAGLLSWSNHWTKNAKLGRRIKSFNRYSIANIVKTAFRGATPTGSKLLPSLTSQAPCQKVVLSAANAAPANQCWSPAQTPERIKYYDELTARLREQHQLRIATQPQLRLTL
jgi:hypothetical protein